MLRFLQTKGHKNLDILTAAEELTRGEVVTKSVANGTVASDTASAGEYLVDTPKDYTGINSVVNPTDALSDTIASGAKCVVVTPMLGERYATTMKNFTAVKIGAPLTAALGKFIRAAGQTTYHWVYGGEYSDPTGTMYIVERVAPATTAATRTLTYNANGGTGTMVDPHSPYYQGDTAEVLPSTFTPPAYKDFVEYDTVANGSGTAYDPGDPVTIGASNIVLYAQYENTYTKLVFDANTGTGTMTDITKYYVDDVIAVPPCTIMPPDGYAFLKWNTAADGSGTDYDPTDEITVTADMIGAAFTLYAIWGEVFSVTYDANGGTGTMTDPDSPYFATSAVTVYECTFTPPTGKVFSAYNDAAAGTGNAYTPGTPFAISADVTLYAQWADA